MAFNRQHFFIAIRAILFLLSALAGILLIYPLELYISGSLFLCLSILIFIWVLRSLNHTTRDFRSFLEAIRFHDFSVKFPVNENDGEFAQLRNEYNLITSEFLRLRQEKEFQHQLLQAIISYLPIGVLVLENREKVVLYNQEAHNLLGVGSLISAKQLGRGNQDARGWWEEMEPGESELLRITTGESSQDVTIRMSSIDILEKTYSIFSLQNIRSELDRKEIESWQKLLRILTHEIINSITPVSSLSASLQDLIPETGAQIDAETRIDLKSGLDAIYSRSEGLAKFVASYRKIARIPRPEPEDMDLKDLSIRLCRMLSKYSNTLNVSLKSTLQPGLFVFADPLQVEQALINLLKNGIEASAGIPDALVTLEGGTNIRGEKWLQVIDNGTGIKADNMDKIFVPFFSTKAEGSGIGLSLSKQILLLNRASLTVESEERKGSTFRVVFGAGE